MPKVWSKVTQKSDGRLKQLAEIKSGAMVKAGVLATATGTDGKPVMDYAPIQEFGGVINVTPKMRAYMLANYGIVLGKTITIPARSFLRTTYQEKKDEWVEKLKDALESGVFTTDEALKLVGKLMQADIQAKINSDIPPPNSEATKLIKKKIAPGTLNKETGETKTLRLTGALYAAIRYEVNT